MLRHVSAVLLSAGMGSTIGTLVWVAWEGGTGAPDPMRFVTGLALFTVMFTIPGAMLLMYLAFALGGRRLSLPAECLLLVVLGTLAGAGMLAVINPSWVALGALYGLATAAAFVATLGALKAFPPRVG